MTVKSVLLRQLAALVEGELVGDGEVQIHALDALDTAGEGTISFLAQAKEDASLAITAASAVIVPLAIETAAIPIIRVRDPYLAAAIVHTYQLEAPFLATGVHAKSHVGEQTVVPDEISIAPFALIGERVCLGQRVTIASGVVIGDDVAIGDDTRILANVTVGCGCRIGCRVTIHPGAVIGSDGYGYATDSRGYHVKRPQVGIVQIDDDVEIGANACVDRATFGVTWIKSGTKIDNMVQVAHNVVVGENCLLVAQVGIAGSTTLGRNVVLGGQAGLSGHIQLEDGVMVSAQAGVHNNQPRGAVIGGTPAMPMKKFARVVASLGRLPEMVTELRRMRKEITALKGAQDIQEKQVGKES
ncbi:MAG: UDP-3-O-(3-hydroxymyristoyl)glucosamine N-acyltransferase [Desulfobulbaceae bacterium]